MDFQKYEEALDNISETIVPTYFNNNKSKYIKAKLLMMEKIKITDYEDLVDPLPFFIPFFRKNLLSFCQNEPDFVGSVLHSTSTISISDINYHLKTFAKVYYITSSEKKIAVAESLYQDANKIIIKILDSSTILNDDINEVLSLIEPLNKMIYYSFPRQIYIRLLNELQFSLKLLYNIENLDRMFFTNRIVIDEYLGLILGLGDLKKEEYSKYTFITILIEDLKIIYKQIEKSYQKTKKYKLPKKRSNEKIISDSLIYIKMNPFPGKKSNNVITINNKQIDNVQNSPFDLLYYLLWLHKNYPDKKAALKIDDIIPAEHINAITENDEQLNRFSYSWNDINNIRFKNEKSKTVNKVNTLLKKQLGINFDAIVENASKYYVLTNRFKSDNIELIPYKTNI